jgi:pyruvate kinase
MESMISTPEKTAAAGLLVEVTGLRNEIAAKAAPLIETATAGSDMAQADRQSIANLYHYLGLRRHDIRSLQRRLMVRGLSSLGRLESRVLPTLDSVIAALADMADVAPAVDAPSEEAFFAGETTLEEATDALFGPKPYGRRGRIMVTLPGDAASNPDLLVDLARRGMDIARINCAHDNPEIWRALANHARSAGAETGRTVRVLMDIAGPKIRTESVLCEHKLVAGDALRLVAAGEPFLSEGVAASAAVSLPEIVTRLSVGDRIRYDDGKLEGAVEEADGTQALIRIRRTKAGGAKIRPEKGLNLPDTALGLSPLTVKDKEDLASVVEYADMIGYSFVSEPADIDLLEKALSERNLAGKTLGLIAKIEQPRAVHNLPELIAQAKRHRHPFGVMIARGDLAAEIGFERLAEMQEEILWLCEAASVPTIWATPSRGEMTDAAMAARAECVMLNKGPAIAEGVSVLDHLIGRMEGHMFKKTPMLRALTSW